MYTIPHKKFLSPPLSFSLSLSLYIHTHTYTRGCGRERDVCICLCGYVYMCIWDVYKMCVWLPVEARGQCQVSFSVAVQFLRQSVSVNLYLTNLVRPPLPHPFSMLGLQACATIPDFLMGPGGPNPDPQAYMAGTSSPAHRAFYFRESCSTSHCNRTVECCTLQPESRYILDKGSEVGRGVERRGLWFASISRLLAGAGLGTLTKRPFDSDM